MKSNWKIKNLKFQNFPHVDHAAREIFIETNLNTNGDGLHLM